MKQFQRVKFVNGSQTEPKVQYGYYVATIPPELRKNVAKIIVLDRDLNAKRVKEVSPVEDTQGNLFPEYSTSAISESASIPEKIFVDIDPSVTHGSPYPHLINGLQLAEEQIRLAKTKRAMSPNKNKNISHKWVRESVIAAGLDPKSKEGFEFYSFLADNQPDVVQKRKPELHGLDKLLGTNQPQNGDKVEVRSLKSEDWERDSTFIGMNGGGFVVMTKFGELELRTYCRKQQPSQEILPPSAHFAGATKFVIKETYSVWRKGDIVEYVPNASEEPLKWWFKNLGFGSSQHHWVRFNNLIPLPKDF